MRFGRTLQQSTYKPWKDHYVDYLKLKGMLREHEAEEDSPWTEEDEQNFSNEIFSVQFEKVARFQQETFSSLQNRVNASFEKLKTLAPAGNSKAKGNFTTEPLKEIESDLDSITNEVKELRRYSNMNYTALLKIVKKHDRKRGHRYKIRPMMMLSLASRPFNSEQGYSPLLNKLSVMYFVIRQHVEETTGAGADQPPVADDGADHETGADGERYTSHKFWVHADNILEVKTHILRRLPALVFSQLATSKDLEVNEDPTITSLYFDNSKFHMYSNKVDRDMKATSVRLRWYGQLNSNPTIMLEKKTVDEKGSSEQERFPIKAKYIKAFIDGEYHMEKSIQKMERQGQCGYEVDSFKKVVKSIGDFIHQKQLEPVVRANYVRSAFQKPSDDRVRISLDTNIAFIREDTVDQDRPCRNPHDWHRTDVDDSEMTYPFKNVNQSEVSLFPFALLEIKIKEDDDHRKCPEWVEDLMASHLVYAAPRFSKFVHGVASLCEDFVNSLPFWISEVGADIRKDPQVAFEEEEARKAARAEGEEVVGSFLGTYRGGSYRPSKSSPVAKGYLSDRLAAEHMGRSLAGTMAASPTIGGEEPSLVSGGSIAEAGNGVSSSSGGRRYGATSLFSGLVLSRYRKARQAAAAKRNQPLPEGVEEPETRIKNSGPLKIEPKVWLANERTYLKWQHISVLLGSMAVALYMSAGDCSLAAFTGALYLTIAVVAGFWGWHVHRMRRRMILERSGRDFDNWLGPVGVSSALVLCLGLNFWFNFNEIMAKGGGEAGEGGEDGDLSI